MTSNGVMAVIKEPISRRAANRLFGRHIALFHWIWKTCVPTHNRVDLWRNLCTSLLYFVVRVRCRRKKVHIRYFISWWVSCFVWYLHGSFAIAITVVVVIDLMQLLPFVSVLHRKFCTVMWIVFRLLETKQDRKKADLAVKRYEDLMKEHTILEKVSEQCFAVAMPA